MKHFHVKNNEGTIIRQGFCNDCDLEKQKLNEDEIVFEGSVDTEPMKKMFINDNYKNKRIEQYPDISEQLDALWHGMDNGIIPMVEDFYLPIKIVKDLNPKN